MSAAPKSSFQRQKWQTETAENVAEINGFLGIEIYASFLAMWLSLRPSGDPNPSSQFSWQRWQTTTDMCRLAFCQGHSPRGLAILSCLPISQPDSHPGSQLVSAQCSVLGPLSSILNPESSLFGAQLAGRHQMK